MLNLRSQLRRKLLAYYFTNPSAEHYLRELARLLGVKPANLSRELASLVRQGLFVARVSGRQKYFRVNRKHPLYDDYRRIVFKTVGVAGQLRDAISRVAGIEEAYIYGSFARHQEDASSDIDVLIVGIPAAEKLEEHIRKLEKQLRREINYTLMHPKEFREKQARKDPFVTDVWRHKRVNLLASS